MNKAESFDLLHDTEKPPRILIVEDENIVALDIKMHLRKYGFEVAGIYSSGEEVLAHIDEVKPDLILMDIKLQGALDGLETSRIIKERYGLPVVLLTAFADEATVQRAKVIEPFGYIIKPFEEKELRTVPIQNTGHFTVSCIHPSPWSGYLLKTMDDGILLLIILQENPNIAQVILVYLLEVLYVSFILEDLYDFQFHL